MTWSPLPSWCSKILMLWSIKSPKLSLRKRHSPSEVRNRKPRPRKTKSSEIDKIKQKLIMIDWYKNNKISLFKILKTICSNLQVSKWFIQIGIKMILLINPLTDQRLCLTYRGLQIQDLTLIYIIRKLNKENSKNCMNNHKFCRG